MNLLPIGSVVRLYNGEKKLMILSRFPLYNSEGTLGYFEYSATVYPMGKVEEEVYFFNHENIEETYFVGYIDKEEEGMQKLFKEKSIPYPQLKVENN